MLLVFNFLHYYKVVSFIQQIYTSSILSRIWFAEVYLMRRYTLRTAGFLNIIFTMWAIVQQGLLPCAISAGSISIKKNDLAKQKISQIGKFRLSFVDLYCENYCI